MDGPRTARALARVELTRQIKDVARQHVARDGAPALSLRAVARELEMSSSAVYRYFASRDELLTALIIDAYDSIGQAAEKADARHDGATPRARWITVGTAIRRWAVRNPHEYALVYGSPVPGYAAPQDTIAHAGRTINVLATILGDAWAAGDITAPATAPPIPDGLRDDALAAAEALSPGIPPEGVLAAIVAWSGLFGLVSFELFGQYENVINHRPAFFELGLAHLGTVLGFPP
ncbi:MAG TPA: TetR/AcrR family transcriptional regulator [Acidimicrobiales bacterium]